MRTKSPFESALPADTVYEEIGDATVPWRYSSIEREYGALRGSSALFDLSACALIAVDGPGAEALLTAVFTRELEFLSPETSIMGLLLDSDGRPVDIVTVYRTDDGFLVETAVGRGTSTLEHLASTASALASAARIERVDGELALLGFEGPKAWTVAEELLDESVTGLPFQAARPVTIDEVPVTISRTGFTGEFGFKIIAPRAYALTIWSKVAESAEPAGHETLEIAMTEFCHPLLHRELDGKSATIVCSGLNWLVEIEKESFIGREALMASRDESPPALPVYFVSDAAAVAPGTAIGSPDAVLGRVVHAVRSPEGSGWCGVAQVEPDCAASNLVFSLHGATGTLRTVSAPIRVPTSWGALLGSAWDADT